MNDVHMAREIPVFGDLRFNLPLVPVEGELKRRVLPQRARGAGNRRRWAGVPAHGVDGNAWGLSHGPLESLGLGRNDFAAIIVAASRAHVVRQLEFAAVRAFLELGRSQRMVTAAHVPLGRRGFSLRDSHCGTFECNFDNNKNCDDLRLISAG
jgi:hypothetical protein